MVVRWVLLCFVGIFVSAYGALKNDPYSRENFLQLLLRMHDAERLNEPNIRCIQPYGTFPHPVSCNKFIVCTNNNPEVQNCPPNQVFTKYGECVEDGDCLLEREIIESDQLSLLPNWECSEEFSAYPVQGDCTKFAICVEGKLIVMPCPRGRTFNYWHGCIEGYNPECNKEHNFTLTKYSSPNPSDFRCPYPNGNFADFQDCSVYHECIDGVTHFRACKPGKKFDHLLSKCLEAERAKCLFRCHQPNGRYPYVSDCHKYIECINGIPSISKCPDGAAFSLHEQKCVSSKRTSCISKTNIPKVKPQERQYFECPEQHGIYPDVMKCSNYWNCSGSVAKSISCSGGLLFNSETMKCDSPRNVTCPPYKSGKKVVCYFDNMENIMLGNQRQQFQPDDMNPYLCTHIHYRNAILDSKTLFIKPGVHSKDIGQRFYERITGLKKLNPNLKVLLTLGGWKDSEGNKYSKLIASSSLWDNFTGFAIGHLYQYGFDGLELDWEFPVCRTPRRCQRSSDADEKDQFTLFIQHVYSTFSTAVRPLLLTLKASGDQSIITAAYDVAAISKSIDYITVMAYLSPGIVQYYAEHPARLHPDPANTSAMTDAESIMTYWKRQGAPKDKLIMGIRADGRKYLLADNNNNKINAPIKVPPYPRNVRFSAICKGILSNDWTLIRDRYAGPYMFKNSTWIGYQDPKALQQKAQFVVRKNYAGIALISSISDDYSASCCQVRNPLLKAAVFAFSRKGQEISTFGCPGRERSRRP